MSNAIRSGALADAAGVNQQTLRYYERRGLLAEPARSPGGHRLYPPEALTVLRVIKTAQRLGFSLEEVVDLVDLSQHRHGQHRYGQHRRGRPGDRSLQSRAATKLSEIETRIAELQTVAASLRTALDYGCEDLTTCVTTTSCPLPFADPRPGKT